MKYHHHADYPNDEYDLSKNYDNKGSILMKRRKSTEQILFNDNNIEYINANDSLKLYIDNNKRKPLAPHDVVFPWLHSLANNRVQKPNIDLNPVIFIRSSNSTCIKNEIIENSGILKSSINPKDILISIDENNLSNYSTYNTNLNTIENKYKFVRELLINFLEIDKNEFLKFNSQLTIDSLTTLCLKFNVLPFLKTDCNILQKLDTSDKAVGNSVSNNIKYATNNSSNKWKQNNIYRRFDLQCTKTFELAKYAILYCFHNDHTDTTIITDHSFCLNCNGFLILLKIAIHYINLSYRASYNDDTNYNNIIATKVFVLKYESVKDIPIELMSIPPMNLSTLRKKPNQLLSEFDITTFNCWETNVVYHERLEMTKLTSISNVDESTNLWAGNLTDYHIYHLLSAIKTQGDNSIENIDDIIQGDKNFNYVNLKTICTMQKLSYDFRSVHSNDSKIFNIPKFKKPLRLFIRCFENAPLPTLKNMWLMYEQLTNNEESHVDYIFPSSGSISLGGLNISSIQVILNLCYLLYMLSEFNGIHSLLYCSNGYTETSFLLITYLIFYWDLPLEEVMLKLHLKFDRSFFLFHSDLQVLGHLQLLLREFSPQKEANVMKYKENYQKGIHLEPLVITNEMFSSIFFVKIPVESDFSKLKGPLPSKILPHLYLGSLEHTQSKYLLKKLGINYIISVGETMSWLEEGSNEVHSRKRGSSSPIPMNNSNLERIKKDSIRRSTLTKQAKSLEESNNSSWSELIEKDGFKILKINNLLDNGQDTLSFQLDKALQFIEECYQNNGKVLVHCMVGVSRSASVCIAECIKRLNCSLLQAYLYVRARRLNIIIQPTLMFMYDLLKWRRKHGYQGDDDWHILCRAIYELNSKYI